MSYSVKTKRWRLSIAVRRRIVDKVPFVTFDLFKIFDQVLDPADGFFVSLFDLFRLHFVVGLLIAHPYLELRHQVDVEGKRDILLRQESSLNFETVNECDCREPLQ